MADKEEMFRYSWRFLRLFYLLNILYIGDAGRVVQFESQIDSRNEASIYRHSLQKRDANTGVVDDAKCQQQETDFLKEKVQIDHTHIFKNESKTSLAMAWAGENDGVLIVVTSADNQYGVTVASTVYRSTDFGASFKDITNITGVKEVVRKHNGLQRNSHDPKKVYLVSTSKVIYVTEDGGKTMARYETEFTPKLDEFIFHSSEDYNSFIMAISNTDDLYITFDNARTWTKILSQVDKVFWGVLEPASEQDAKYKDHEKTVYATMGSHVRIDPILQHFYNLGSVTAYTLKKSTDGGATWTTIRENVISFERRGHFLYASVLKDKDSVQGYRLLQISTDCGTTWNEAQLPTIEPDRFYSVMDVEQNLIFMHVDNPDNTGHGTLYTSANKGIVYSESLPMHLYPNFGETHDFYKVKSLRGVYITSQLAKDNAIHTMITYNQGATWQRIPRPNDNTPCRDETKDCHLHLHGLYSMSRGITAFPPLSETTALGIILAHGHVAESLQKTPPDVYVSRDGGYSWQQSLKGPHHYSIGDQGGFLAAVSLEDNPKVVKFSTDEGRCWHEYTFTNKSLVFTGLLTEPEGKSSVVMVWAYSRESSKWEVHVIDFKAVITRQCGNDDYEPWVAHAQHRQEEGVDIRGCLLGMKETFDRLKQDSWCVNGHDHEKKTTKSQCTCTREDYECDYGYFRPGGSDLCKKQTKFVGPEVDICLRGHEEKIVSEGYRKIPGDVCAGGFSPKSRDIDMNKACSETNKALVHKDETKVVKKEKHIAKTVVIVIFFAVMSFGALMSVFFIRKYWLLRKHRVEYRYSMLNQTERAGDVDHDLDNALSPAPAIYQDSDEELTTEARPSAMQSRPVQNGTAKKNVQIKTAEVKHDKNPFLSYHDDSDDDMLS